jgi:hypothetical protein
MPDGTPATERRLWWRLFGLLAIAGASWSLAVPLMTGPDEPDHASRAAAVARGHLVGVRWAPQTRSDHFVIRVLAPASYVTVHDIGWCWTWKGEPRRSVYDESVQEALRAGSGPCPEMTGGQHEEAVVTNEFRGQPFYYAAVGLPTLAFPAATGAYLMRLVGALLCSAFLASGLVTLSRFPAPKLAVLGAAVALTPTTLYFAGVVNPIGLEIAAALGASSGLMTMVRRAPTGGSPSGRLVARTGLAFVALVTTRGLSPAFGVLVVLAALVVAPPGRIRELLRQRHVRRWSLAVLGATVLSLIWVVHITGRFPLPPTSANGLDHALGELAWWAREVVGLFGATTVTPPVVVPLLWLLALVTVVWLARRGTETRHLVVAAVMALVSYGMLVWGDALNVPDTSVVWQGRHVLPGLVAALVVVVAGSCVAATVDTASIASTATTNGAAIVDRQRMLRRLGPGLLGLLVVVQVWCFAYAVRHYTVGHDGPANPFVFLLDTDWSPPLLPPWLYVGLFAASLAALAVVLWRTATTVHADAPDERANHDAEAGNTPNPAPATLR